MPTTIIKTIKPAGGGDHLTLNAFDSVEQKDLVAANEILIAECHPGGNLVSPSTSRLFIGDVGSSWLTGPNNYLEIRAAPGFHYDGGPYDTVKFPFAEWNITSGDSRSFRTSLQFFRIIGIQMRAIGNSGRVFLIQDDMPDADIRLEENLFVSDGVIGTGFPFAVLLQPSVLTSGVCGGVNGNGRFFNNVIYFDTIPSITQGGGQGIFVRGDLSNWDVFNNTIVIPNANAGASACVNQLESGTLTSQNNYLHASFAAIAYGAAPTKGVNDATSTAEALTAAFRNVAYDASNFVVPGTTPQTFDTALVSGSVLVGNGADLSGSGVINAVTGVPRTVPYSIGAHQFAVGDPNAAYWRYWRQSLGRRSA